MKKILFLTSGIILIIFGSYLSTIHYNPISPFATVHEFSYGCITQNPQFMGIYDSAYERGTCNENYMLSLILLSFVIGGGFLIYKSKTIFRGKVNTP